MNLRIWAAAVFSVAAIAQAEPSNEALTVSAYPTASAWTKVTDTANGPVIERRWVPADKPAQEATEVLTEQLYANYKGTAPLVALNGLAAQTKSSCADFKADGVLDQAENGYLTAYAEFYCIRMEDTSQEVVSHLKVISGKRALYVVRLEALRPADPSHKAGMITFNTLDEPFLQRFSAIQDWLRKKVQLCPPADGSACPASPTVVLSYFLTGDAPGRDDVSKTYGWTPGITTLTEVEQRFGKPSTRLSGPEGRYANVYIPEKYSPVVCVFNKTNVLTSTYADKK